MIGHKEKGRKRVESAKMGGIDEPTPVKKLIATGGCGMSYNPELDKFSADQFIPEKHKQAEPRLTKSSLPPFK